MLSEKTHLKSSIAYGILGKAKKNYIKITDHSLSGVKDDGRPRTQIPRTKEVAIFLYPVYGVVIRIKVCESSELYTQNVNVMLCKLKINKRVKKKQRYGLSLKIHMVYIMKIKSAW